MSSKSISVSIEQIYWLRELYESYRATMEGVDDDGVSCELEQIKKHVIPLIKELEKIKK